MKRNGSLLFWILLSVSLIGIFLFQYNTPKEFVWKPTFSTYDKQPFGSYVFDDVVSASVADYSLVNKTFYQLYQEYSGESHPEEAMGEIAPTGFDLEDAVAEYPEADTIVPLPESERMAVLLTEQSVDFTGTDVEALFKFVKQGHKVMLCMNYFPSELCDSLYFTTTYDSYFSVSYIERYAKEGNQRDSLFFGTDSIHAERIYAVYPHLHPVYIEERRPSFDWEEHDRGKSEDRMNCDSLETLVWNKKKQPVAMRLFMGAGELFIVTTPLLFTNYGMLDGDNASYVFRLLSYMRELPLVRLEAYGINNQPSRTPLRYFLSQPPLRWALYLTMIVVVVFMVFTAKRRQRVIPVVHSPANQTLRFTQLIGNLYYQKKEYTGMVRKKYLYFCTEVKRLNGLDLQSDEPDEVLCQRLADKMGSDVRDVWPGFRELKYLLHTEKVISEEEMIRNIDRMNDWMHNLYN